MGSVANPAVLYDGNNAFVCYEASPQEGGGNVVLKFDDVIDFRITPLNVDGLEGCRYPIKLWAFSEILGAEETLQWKVLDPRFWLISFRDVTIEIHFETVSLVRRDTKGGPQHKTLMDVLAN